MEYPSVTAQSVPDPVTTRLGKSGWTKRVLVVLGIVLLTVVTFRQLKDCGLLGYDAYPLIVASRIQTPADFFGTFTEQLMDGRYRYAFYRPLLNLTIAFDYAVWGLRPWGYALTTVLLFAGCALAVFGLLRRLAGPGAKAAPCVAVIWFILHAGHRDLMPYLARRADVLCCLLMVWSLWMELSRRRGRGRGFRWGPAVLTLAAMASKETAFVQPLLVGFAVLIYTAGGAFQTRTLETMKAVAPHLAAGAAALAARFAVLGRLGGHADLSFHEMGANVLRFAFSLMHRLGLPPSTELIILDWDGMGIGVAAALLASLGVLAIRPGSKPPLTEAAPNLVRAAAVAISWFVFPVVLYAASDKLRAWYGLVPAAGFAMLVGILMEAGIQRLRNGGWRSRAVGVVLTVFSMVTLVWNAANSPAVQTMSDWQAATAANEAFLYEVTKQASTAEYGTRVNMAPARIKHRGDDGSSSTGGPATQADYSIQAWVELTVPDRRVRVRKAAPGSGRLQHPASNEVLILLYPHR